MNHGTAGPPSYAGRAPAATYRQRLRSVHLKTRELGPTLTLIGLIVVFALLRPTFVSVDNMRAILESAAIPVVLAVGMTFVIVQGSIDLSVEGVMAASSMVVSLLVSNSVTPYDLGFWGILVGVLSGAGFGIVNGLLYAYVRLPSLIVTLATWFIGVGIATLLFPGRQPQIQDTALTSMALQVHGVSDLVFIAAAVLVVGLLVQSYTNFGRVCYAIGIDERLTRQSGLRVNFHKLLAFLSMGLMSGVAGVMISAQLSVGNPSAGYGFLFPTISGAVIGGTLLSGGRGGVLQSVVGVLILSVLQNGMVQLGLDPNLRHVIEGATIIGALVAGNWRLRTRIRVVK